MMKSQRNVLPVILFLGVAIFSPVHVAHAKPGQQLLLDTSSSQSATAALMPATENLRGVVDRVDQGNDTITLRLPSDAKEQFKVQDGLIFNAVRFGDAVEVSVQRIAGTKTIVGLSKE
jgi:Cu/Ag efflux protein CusF